MTFFLLPSGWMFANHKLCFTKSWECFFLFAEIRRDKVYRTNYGNCLTSQKLMSAAGLVTKNNYNKLKLIDATECSFKFNIVFDNVNNFQGNDYKISPKKSVI